MLYNNGIQLFKTQATTDRWDEKKYGLCLM